MYNSIARGIITAVISTAAATAFGAPIITPTIQDIGSLGGLGTYAGGISADGSTVVGESPIGVVDQGYRWTAATGINGLGFLSGGGQSRAYATNADGTIVVGFGISSQEEAFKWTAATGMKGLGFYNNQPTVANAISPDGGVIVGVAQNGTFHPLVSVAGSAFTSPAILTGDNQFTDVSADGKTFVGGFLSGTRYSAAGGADDLGVLSGYTYSSVSAVSADGNTLVGVSYSNDNTGEATVWTPARGLTTLKDLSGGALDSKATDVSFDGGIIVGRGSTASGYEAFIYTKTTGMFRLSDFLTARYDMGILLNNVTFDGSIKVSADGRTIAASYMTTATTNEHTAYLKLPDVVAISSAAAGSTIPSGQHLYSAGAVFPLDSARPKALTIYDTDNNAGTLSFFGFGAGSRVSVLLDFSFLGTGPEATTLQEVYDYFLTANQYKDFQVVTSDPLLSANPDFDLLLTWKNAGTVPAQYLSWDLFNFSDVALDRVAFGAPVSVPEPASLSLLAAAGFALLQRRRR